MSEERPVLTAVLAPNYRQYVYYLESELEISRLSRDYTCILNVWDADRPLRGVERFRIVELPGFYPRPDLLDLLHYFDRIGRVVEWKRRGEGEDSMV